MKELRALNSDGMEDMFGDCDVALGVGARLAGIVGQIRP